MYGLVQRATRYPYEASVILKATSATSLCDIGADAIGGPHYLFSNSVSGEPVPRDNYVPDTVGNLFGQLIDLQLLKVCSFHLEPAN